MRKRYNRREFIKTSSTVTLGALCFGHVPLGAGACSDQPATLYIVPNTHGTIAGWLTDFDTERNYCLNNYLDHLDRVKTDANYRFAYSEVPNLLSFFQFAPDRLPELKQRIREGRVELCNGFFLESTVNVSGGEALAQLGVQGLRWYEKFFGLRPRIGWLIDVVGIHRQMPQIIAGLGLEAMIFCRNNPVEKTAFWWVAPDGTGLLAICNPSSYAELPQLFTTKAPLGASELDKVAKLVEWKKQHSPSQRTLLALVGGPLDYSLAPARAEYPTEFLEQWGKRCADVRIRFSIPSDYVKALQAEVAAGETHLEEYRGDTGYCFNAFWFDLPQVKQQFRRLEHQLQAAEMLATVASLRTDLSYPSQALYYCWINMLVNMDRNALWGAAASNVFRDPQSWDAEDRYHAVKQMTDHVIAQSLQALAGKGESLALFNPLNWQRDDPLVVSLPPGKRLAGLPCEPLPDDPSHVMCRLHLPELGLASFQFDEGAPPPLERVAFDGHIETRYYLAWIDTKTGDLASLKLKSSGQELLGGPANVVVAETVAGLLKEDPGNYMLPRPQRKILDTSNRYAPRLGAFRGSLAKTLAITSDFHGGSRLKRVIRFYEDFPRIDFEVDLELRAHEVLITVDFPLADDVVNRARGIPFGFASFDPRHPFRPLEEYMKKGQTPVDVGESESYGFSAAILPAVRWSHYQLAGGVGIGLLDRGLTGHELNGRTVTLGLINSHGCYAGLPNELLAGQGHHHFAYALLPHHGKLAEGKIPRAAWEFNAPVFSYIGARSGIRETYLRTSENVIVAAMRRDVQEIEVRLYEWMGVASDADVHLELPHGHASLTNLMGEHPSPLRGGPAYRFAIRPQEIVTVRFTVDSSVARPELISDWAPLVPANKRKDLERRIGAKGHPPAPWVGQ